MSLLIFACSSSLHALSDWVLCRKCILFICAYDQGEFTPQLACTLPNSNKLATYVNSPAHTQHNTFSVRLDGCIKDLQFYSLHFILALFPTIETTQRQWSCLPSFFPRCAWH